VIAECVLLPTIRLAVIVVLFLAGWRLWAVVAGTTLASLIASWFLATRARSDFHDGAPPHPGSWADAFRVVRYSTVLAGSMVVTALTTSMDMLVLGHFTTAEDLGQYSLVKTLLILTGVLGVACGQGLEVLVADRYFRGDLAGMVRVMSVSARFITLVTVPIFAIFLFWGAQIALLFGPSFAVSQAVVCWLAAGPLISMMFWPSATGLSMTGRHFLELKILAAGLVVATVLCWVAVPAFGQLGAAIAMCTSVALANLARVLAVRRFIGAFPFGNDIFLIAAAGIVLAWGTDAVVAQFALSSSWSTIAGIGCFVVAYAVAGWTHLLSESEKSGIHGAVRSTAGILSSKVGDLVKRS
jgi:O-antigen/teichoic acid export membrane protein